MTSDGARAVISFTRDIPPREAIPASDLAVIACALLREAPEALFQYAPSGQHKGGEVLREELARLYDADSRAVFVGNGSLQVLDLLAAHLLLRASSRDVYVEAPTYDRAVQIFQRHGARVVGLPMERDGLAVDALQRRLDVDALRRRLDTSLPAFVYTIPDFQNPTGVTLSEPKRWALVALAARYGFPVVEDVMYRELRYHGSPLPSLAQLAPDGARVMTLGSLSKVLSPGLRVGYAISDADTSRALARLAESTYLSPAPLTQAIAARAFATGVVATNIDRVRTLLQPRHDAAVDVASDLLGTGLLGVPDGGYYLAAHLPGHTDERMLLTAAKEAGLALTPGSVFYPPGTAPPTGTTFVRLPFQAMEPAEFAVGLKRLVTVAERTRP